MLRIFLLFLLLAVSNLANSQAEFPLLTGRVVDNAQLLSASTKSNLNALLAQHEAETSNQLVVVTLETLNGYDISDYGYQLGRHWQIGQLGKDNGVLLIVAKQERKVRIEVGYGLEGALTDALSSQIIRNEISPKFKQGQFDHGINAGVEAILLAIKGEYQASDNDQKGGESSFDKVIPFVMFGAVGGQMLLAPLLGARRKKKDFTSQALASGGAGVVTGLASGFILSSLQLGLMAAAGAAVLSFIFFNGNGGGGAGRRGRRGGGYHRRGGSWGGSSGGGYSGGGGGFGGGGASGGW